MRAVDTNVLVRLVTRDDDKQCASAEEFIERGAWVPQLALAEMVWTLRVAYGFSHSEIAFSIGMLLRNKQVVVQDADVVEAALEHYRCKPSLGFTDCLILEIARKAGHLPLGTFDKALAKLDGTQRL